MFRELTSFPSLLLLGTLLLVQGCGKALEFGGTCNVGEDQKGSFMARVDAPPVRVVADSNFAQINGISDIQKAVDEWNAKGQTVAKRSMFKLLQGNIPDFVRSVDPRDCSGTKFGSETQFYVIREERPDRWKKLGLSDSIPGVTIRCSSGGQVVQQIVYINPTLIDRTQLATVILHELGHSLGLDHSCQDGNGTSNFIGCSKVKASHPYRDAVMFPSLSRSANLSAFETKETLKENDATRAECLYSPK